ncbi:MAG TPA: glycosyltransferase [Steroidobacteraceae bacterium]|nr:glycosyltransferase [Steroidobacteraceae bacterium]
MVYKPRSMPGDCSEERRSPYLLILLRSLNRGGAERQAVNLARGLKLRGWSVAIACFYGGGPFAKEAAQGGVPVFDLKKRGRWDILPFALRLGQLLRRERPDIIHGYLPIENLLAVTARVIVPGVRIVWGIRASNMDLGRYDWLHRLSHWFEHRMVRFAHLVISNSTTAASLRVRQGFPVEIVRTVPNGIDCQRFTFDVEERARLRRDWAPHAGLVLVGLIGRLDPMKDHATFLRAAAHLAMKDSCWRFICVGDGSTGYKEQLFKLSVHLGLSRRLSWVVGRDDMVAVYSALDMSVSSSLYGEGFPNVVAEAMACGCPCIVTDVGDSPMVVGTSGVVVPSGDYQALSAGMEELRERLRREGAALRKAARGRIEREFGTGTLVDRSEELFRQLIARSPKEQEK